ncbi:PREDICTED: uncharacterized protein LOC106334478 [Brassica oleracea var. oleracea]|uniref:uncharacterized protein LOC106334478 n=1 Tax=Brassica oleracea var. oleracea TaxID=109376 RepID=UPI0006A6B08C|nr:PREDICTED: uncharacterized protein LOC106334478 [Brassica oleracea var. oleracea]
MAAYANRQAKHCDQCQRHTPVSKLPPENLTSIRSLWPFRKWSMDIVGKLPIAPGQKSNGQAESTNKTVVNMLKKRLEGSHGKWAEELHGVLWAYRTTPKTATQENPYSLVYGSEAIIPTEMHVRTTVSGSTSQEENNELRTLSLDLLDETREAARLRN